MNNKAQITIFIILGIFLLLIATLVIYFVYSQTKIDLKEFPKDVLDNVQKLATSCLEQSANNAITLLAKQGGVLYIDQGGLTDLSTAKFVEVGGEKVAKLVALPNFNLIDAGVTISTNSPHYPWTTFPKFGTAKKYEANILFGLNRIQPLEQDTDQKSWKSQIVEKTQKDLLNCMNIPQLQTQGITLETQPKITATITDKDVLMTGTEINLKAQDGTTAKIQNIRARVPIKLKELHTKVTKVIDAEVFNMINNPAKTPGVNTKKSGENTIVTILQDKTIFQFSIPNRRPALEFIADQKVCEGSTISYSNNQMQITPPSPIPEGKTCNSTPISLKVIDPDDDTTTFDFSPPLPITLTQDTVLKIITKDQSLEDYQELNLKLK